MQSYYIIQTNTRKGGKTSIQVFMTMISIRCMRDSNCSSLEYEKYSAMNKQRGVGAYGTSAALCGVSKPPLRSILKTRRRCTVGSAQSQTTPIKPKPLQRRVVCFSDMSRWETNGISSSSSHSPQASSSESQSSLNSSGHDAPRLPTRRRGRDHFQTRTGGRDAPPTRQRTGAPRKPLRVHSEENLFKHTIEGFLERFEAQRARYLQQQKQEAATFLARRHQHDDGSTSYFQDEHEQDNINVIHQEEDLEEVKDSLREMQNFLTTLHQKPDSHKLLRDHMTSVVSQATQLLDEDSDSDDDDDDDTEDESDDTEEDETTSRLETKSSFLPNPFAIDHTVNAIYGEDWSESENDNGVTF